MRRFAIPTVLFALLAPMLRADVKPADPVTQRVARSVAVFVGKVKSIEEKTIDLESYPGNGAKSPYKVAVITVTDPILGAKKSYRVAFREPGGRRGFDYLNFKVGDEGLFFLTRFHGQVPYR